MLGQNISLYRESKYFGKVLISWISYNKTVNLFSFKCVAMAVCTCTSIVITSVQSHITTNTSVTIEWRTDM